MVSNLCLVVVLFTWCLIPRLALAKFNVVEQASKLAYYTEDYAPANFYQRGKLVGVSVETLRLVWHQMGVPEQKIKVVPWARGYRSVQRENNSVLFTMARIPQREDRFKWVGPIYLSHNVLVAKSKNNLTFDQFEQTFNYRVAMVRGDVSEIILHSLGFPNIKMAKATDLKQAFLMLRSDRVDMIVMTRYGLDFALSQFNETASKYQVVWDVATFKNYYAFNRDTPDSLVQAFQLAFDQIEPQRKEIINKYNVIGITE